jgi:hypothetical protein
VRSREVVNKLCGERGGGGGGARGKGWVLAGEGEGEGEEKRELLEPWGWNVCRLFASLQAVPMKVTLVNDFNVPVLYKDTVGRVAEVLAGDSVVVRADPGASVGLLGFTATVGDMGRVPSTTPATRPLLPQQPAFGIQYGLLQTVTSDAILLHGSMWNQLLITNSTAQPATIQLNDAAPVAVPPLGTVQTPAPWRVTRVRVRSATGVFDYSVAGEASADMYAAAPSALVFAPASDTMFVTRPAPGVWGQLGAVRTAHGTFGGGWTISGPPSTVLRSGPVLATTSSSCAA